MYYGYPKYVSVAEKEAKALKALAKLRKSRPDLEPVTLEDTRLARTWWAKAWNMNLTSYADFQNRIGRGRSYVRHHAVLHLHVAGGSVVAMVQGGETRPYDVRIAIQPLSPPTWTMMVEACAGQIDSLGELLKGQFPKSLSALFTSKGTGLFPTPEEISMSCSCPDGAYLCKHVAATMYGVGVRLDERPELLFVLRGVEVENLISTAISDQSDRLLKKSRRRSTRVLADDVSELFGIDMDMDPQTATPSATPSKGLPNAVRPNDKGFSARPR